MICSNCGKMNESGAKFCNGCGKTLQEEKKGGIKCPSCGTEYSEMATFCGICGKELPKAGQTAQAASTTTPPADRRCKWCGAPVGIYDIECPTCKRDLRWSAESTYTGQSYSEMEDMYTSGTESQTSTPVIAGVLVIIAGVLGLLSALVVLAVGNAVIEVGSSLTCCGLLMLLFALAGMIGGFFAATRSHFVFALLGSLLVMASIGPYFLSAILGLIGLILIAVSKDQFD